MLAFPFLCTRSNLAADFSKYMNVSVCARGYDSSCWPAWILSYGQRNDDGTSFNDEEGRCRYIVELRKDASNSVACARNQPEQASYRAHLQQRAKL